MHLQKLLQFLRSRALTEPTLTHSEAPPANAFLFRRKLAAALPGTAGRFVFEHGTENKLKFMGTEAGGNCGFQAVAWALISAHSESVSTSATTIRQITAEHVRSNPGFYATRVPMTENEEQRNSISVGEVEAFAKSVVEEGPNGHWLGARWGALELVAVARACKLWLRLFSWDGAYGVRCYFEERAGDKVVGLLYTGKSDCGHFDVLVQVPQGFWQWYRRQLRRKR